ncbi:SOS response-associated peptidase [Galbitalea soli]|uniref:Abasic site processing protein n=1 Tax=Galbitalea soli TaxID=1268042 RepID=A0A7C9TNN9_9MICO|nr:SOS response-associated peptidase [Galbitalea soli]NEM89821.1 SOS response-associated peptidase [Galbitalea soli]NYJ30525.1 putative SOS response-associated peptidase YedK [Galbitalea soli]
MCGRFALDRKTTDLVTLFDVDIEGDRLPEPSSNIAPTQRIAVVIDSLPRGEEFPEPVRRLESARWGLVPGWAASPTQSAPLFNARVETVQQKPSFEKAFAHRRAVIPASGYYEWETRADGTVAQFIHAPGHELLLFAGLYEWWKNTEAPEGSPERWLLSATILTCPSTGGLAELHERMPVFLDADLVETWLDPVEEGTEELLDQLVAGAAEVADRVLIEPRSPVGAE